MWRYDANHSAASPQELPEQLYAQWIREYPALDPVWDDPLNLDLMQYDKVYEPVVYGETLFIASNAYDRIVALNANTGAEKWTFHADGPIRFSPIASNGNLYFACDDGCLYCLDAGKGTLNWKFRAVPSHRKVLGNERLISTWPMRGAPVLKDGVIYFGAGIWPFMGVFLYALDAETGEEIWTNDGFGFIYIKQPHNSPSFANVAPQGYLTIAGDRLLVPGGRSVPACFDLKTGDYLYYRFADHNKTGGAFVTAIGDKYVNYHRDFVTSLYDINEGDLVLPQFGKIPVLTETALYSMGETIIAHDFANLRQIEYETTERDRRTNEVKLVTKKKWVLDTVWEAQIDATGDLIKAGNRLYAGGKNCVSAIDLPTTGGSPKIAWQAPIEGTAARLVAANDRLYAVTLEGRLYCFGGEEIETKFYPNETKSDPLPDSIVSEAETILKTTGIHEGYCLVYGLANGDLAEALVRQSKLRVIAADPDPAKVDRLRRRFTESGLYGKRLTVLTGDPVTLEAPPYLASLTAIEDYQAANRGNDETFWNHIFRSLRPYGGAAWFKAGENDRVSLIRTINQLNLPNAKIYETADQFQLVREGALTGSADWTHQYGNAANTIKSNDRRVKLPLGILWFGGNSNTDVLPRHGHGPPEQVMDGRLIIQGMDCLSARDVYTGRVLWKRTLPNLGNYGVYFDHTYQDTPLSPAYNQIHIPGANARGTNYVVTSDGVYIIQGSQCLVLDPATGETINTIALPTLPGKDTPPDWGYIGVYQDYLVAGAEFVYYKPLFEIDADISEKRRMFYDFDTSASKSLIIMDRHTGAIRWTFQSSLGLRHNAIVMGNGKLFCIDKIPDHVQNKMKRRGITFTGSPRIIAFNIHNGDILWSKTENVFGTWLGYSEPLDILVESGRASRDMTIDEPSKGMVAYTGNNGARLWENEASYSSPLVIHGESIITNPNAYDLRSGEQIQRVNPLTGERAPWSFTRNYGCNYAIASEHLLTFRSAAAGFFDLAQDGGTGNFGGFKSSCTSNLIIANGVLNAPDYTRTCSCSYQNQTSLAMIHDPDVEVWTFNPLEWNGLPIQQIGINLGAPGDRKTGNGTLWLEYPLAGSPSPEIEIQTEPEEIHYFRHHSIWVSGEELKWVAASGAEGIRQLTIPLTKNPRPDSLYTVRLIFMEPDTNAQPGARVFDVSLQNLRVLRNLDIVKETGSPKRVLIKEFQDVSIAENLVIDLTPMTPQSQPILCGVELIINH